MTTPASDRLARTARVAVFISQSTTGLPLSSFKVVDHQRIAPPLGIIDQRKAARETTQSIRSSLDRGIF